MGKNTGLKRWSILRSPWCKLNENCTDFEDFLWFLVWCVISHSFTHSDYQPYLLLQIIWGCLQNFLHAALIIQHQNKTKTILCMYVCVHVYVRYLSAINIWQVSQVAEGTDSSLSLSFLVVERQLSFLMPHKVSFEE